MTKDQLQQELKQKVKPGIKPSDLKKLKRSKSDSDINPNPPTQLLQDQLSEKQKEVESLRKDKEELSQKLTSTTIELDNSLLARYEAVKQFDKLYTKLQLVKQELADNVDQASTEILNQDEQITKLREQKAKAQIKIQELEQDLTLTQRLVKLKEPIFTPESDFSYLRYALYGLIAVVIISWFLKKNK